MCVEKELLACIETWNQQAPTRLVHRSIEWEYNTAGALHHGGLWERLVKSCKRSLYSILGARTLTPKVLDTAFFSVGQSLNPRSLTPVGGDLVFLENVMPNQFLLGRRTARFPSLSFEEGFNHKKTAGIRKAIW